MRPLSEATSRIASKSFSRKYVALGRVIKQWPAIMGDEFADKAQPLKINYRKAMRGKKPTATLDIATSSSYATTLPYQKDLILERINQLFGDQWITDIRFVVSEISHTPLLKKKITSPLTMGEKKYLSETLNQVDDPEFKEKLESFGKALLADIKLMERL